MFGHVKLARVNTILLIAILFINGYIIVLPVLPNVLFWAQHRDPHRVQKMEAQIHTKPGSKPDDRPRENRLVAPSMLFDEPVFDGPNATTLRKGLWRRPNTSTPDKGGNTVFVGHRLTYSNPRGTLYNLDKVHVGDDLAVWWQGKRYLYNVTETKVVKPTEIGVEAPTKDPQLTIYTCTPLWLPKDRLVVIAKLEDIE